MMRLPGGRKRERQGGHSRKGRALTSITDFSMFRSITRQVSVVFRQVGVV